MDAILQQILNGIGSGAIYALVAAGLALVFGTAGLLNFAHAEFVMLGAIFTWIFGTQLGISYILVIPIATICVIIAGEIVRRVAGVQTGRSFESMIVLTLAASMILQQGVMNLFGANVKLTEGFAPGHPLIFGGIRTTVQTVVIILVSIAVIVALDIFIRKTSLGKTLNAVAQNRETALLLGVRVERLTVIAFGLGSLLAGLAGALIAPVLGASPRLGVNLLIVAFAAVIVGGVGNVRGAMYVALGIGVLEAITAQFIGFEFRAIVAYAVMFLAVLVRPNGVLQSRAAL